MRKLIVILMMGTAPAAFAGGTWTNVTVTNVWGCTSQQCSPNGEVQVQFSAAGTGQPACVSSSYHTWAAVDVSTPGGAFTAALLQSAHLSGQTITVYGIGNCSFFAAMVWVAWVNED